MRLFLRHNVLKNINIIQTKIDDTSLHESDTIHVNKIDNIITQCMLKVKKKLKHSSHSRPWYSTLVFAILEVRLWKLITSSIYATHHNSSRIETIQAQMQLLTVSSRPHPIEQKNKSMIKNNLKTENENLKKIKKDATKIHESYLHHCVDEAELEGNLVHVTFLRNLITIERQIKIHKEIRKYTSNKTKRNFKSILVPKDSTLK